MPLLSNSSRGSGRSRTRARGLQWAQPVDAGDEAKPTDPGFDAGNAARDNDSLPSIHASGSKNSSRRPGLRKSRTVGASPFSPSSLSTPKMGSDLSSLPKLPDSTGKKQKTDPKRPTTTPLSKQKSLRRAATARATLRAPVANSSGQLNLIFKKHHQHQRRRPQTGRTDSAETPKSSESNRKCDMSPRAQRGTDAANALPDLFAKANGDNKRVTPRTRSTFETKGSPSSSTRKTKNRKKNPSSSSSSRKVKRPAAAGPGKVVGLNHLGRVLTAGRAVKLTLKLNSTDTNTNRGHKTRGSRVGTTGEKQALAGNSKASLKDLPSLIRRKAKALV
eukprot:INCI8885.2.p1 GENE.INCI8885.2~~INCI8885.2.p1  ORF type:complete len:333 (-),score=53.96 INCI8885.2:187-1185(-)